MCLRKQIQGVRVSPTGVMTSDLIPEKSQPCRDLGTKSSKLRDSSKVLRQEGTGTLIPTAIYKER